MATVARTPGTFRLSPSPRHSAWSMDKVGGCRTPAQGPRRLWASRRICSSILAYTISLGRPVRIQTLGDLQTTTTAPVPPSPTRRRPALTRALFHRAPRHCRPTDLNLAPRALRYGRLYFLPVSWPSAWGAARSFSPAGRDRTPPSGRHSPSRPCCAGVRAPSRLIWALQP